MTGVVSRTQKGSGCEFAFRFWWCDEPDNQVYIVSHPKAGRTWVRVMLGRYLCERYGFDEKEIVGTRALTAAAGLMPTQFTHDHSAIVDGLDHRDLSLDKSGFREKHVVFLVRGPKDMLVSCLFQATKRVDRFQVDLHAFLRDERFGATKAAIFLVHWYAAQSIPRTFLTIRYEDLHLDPRLELQRVLEVIGATEPDAGLLDAAVHYAGFKNMQALERSDYFCTDILRAGSIEDKESYKVRRGHIGGYREYLIDATLPMSMASLPTSAVLSYTNQAQHGRCEDGPRLVQPNSRQHHQPTIMLFYGCRLPVIWEMVHARMVRTPFVPPRHPRR